MPYNPITREIAADPTNPKWKVLRQEYPNVYKRMLEERVLTAREVMYVPSANIYPATGSSNNYTSPTQELIRSSDLALQQSMLNGMSTVYHTGINVQAETRNILVKLARIGANSANNFALAAMSFATTMLQFTKDQSKQNQSSGGLLSSLFG